MSYEKQTWKTGDIITSEGLNHIEDGIANNNNIYFINIIKNNNNKRQLDKTFAEIEEAALTKIVIFKQNENLSTHFDFLLSIQSQGAGDVFIIKTLHDTMGEFLCEQDKNQYPVYHEMK